MEEFRCYGCMALITEPVCPHCGHPSTGVNAPGQVAAGTLLRGRYLVGRALDQSAASLMYVGLDQTRDKTVSIRTYYDAEAGRKEAALLLGNEELRTVSGTVDAFEMGGTVFLVQDQVRGPAFAQYIGRRGGALEAQEALRILRGVVGAVAVLHQNGLAHGGIGIEKIVLDPMGGARLLGFAENVAADPAADVLALSTMLRECVAPGTVGDIPGLTEQQQMALQMGSDPDPARRFGSAVALRRALLGEMTLPMGQPAPLEVLEPQPAAEPVFPVAEAVAEEPAAEPAFPGTEAIGQDYPFPVAEPEEPVAEPAFPGTEAIGQDYAFPVAEPEPAVPEQEPAFPKTEPMGSAVLSREEPMVPPRPQVEPMEIPASSRMPATEIVSEFKIQLPREDAQDQGAYRPPVQEPVQPEPHEIPFTEPAPQWQPEPQTQTQWQPEPQPQWQPQPTSQWQPEPPKKKTGLIVGIIVGAVVLLAVLVICFFTVHIWKDATCEAPRTCVLCGRTEGKTVGHDYAAATCEEPQTCVDCGATKGEALGHSWQAATCEAAKTCRTCGKSEGSPLDHNWKAATCEEPKTCRNCGTTEGGVGGHTWKEATCEEAKRCTTCGAVEGSALGHSWKAATYTEPETCSRCGETRGDPEGYIEMVDGEFQYFEWGSTNTYCLVFDKPVKKCSGFTLYFEPVFNYNAWVSEWKLLYQDTSGTWHEYGAFTLDASTYCHEFNFSPKLDIRAVAVAPRINGTYSYSFDLGVFFLYYTG